uniref:Methyltransferase-like protein 17, mitochondrial n=2 Tax=Clastoptera arizonana TaxID=38151 RepID=A0A1B6D0H8_9HEMI
MEVMNKLNYARFNFYLHHFKRQMATKPKLIAELDQEVYKNIEDNGMRPRKHPGRFKFPSNKLPDNVVNAVQSIVKDYPIKKLVEDANLLERFLNGRYPPGEDEEIKEKKAIIKQKVKSKYNLDTANMTEDQKEHFRKVINNQVTTILHQQIYNWKRLDFNEYFCLVYFFGRAAPNYAVISRVFNEISIRHPDFKPKTLFDFGSGIGTVSWVAKNLWNDTIKEFFCVDSSSDMNNFASLILREGKTDTPVPSNVYYRQFLPSQHRPYDMVVSAFSLFELPSSHSRLETLLNLWNKTQEYLIVIEQGTAPGYKLVVEARDFILSLKDKDGNATGYVFAPCSHDKECPSVSINETCNFVVSYFDLELGQREGVKKEIYSYVVLKKGVRSSYDYQWPRIVKPVLKKSKHAICRMCTKEGKHQEIIFTASKHGKIPYKCARSSDWGDLLPINITNVDSTDGAT